MQYQRQNNKAEIGRGKEKTYINIPILIDTRLLIQANSGGGKSWCIRKVLEETYGSVQHIVLDMEGEFGTLREKYDYILIGKEGDIPISIKTAELLARRILELNVSAILDLYELKHHERILFVKRFLDALINAPKKLWHPCLVVVDEAHVMCPEKGKAESMSSVIDLCTRGRKRGFCAILATQRLSKLHKDAAAELNNKLIGRTGLDIDMKRAGEELGFSSKQQTLSLRDLDAGEFYAFGPAISQQIIRTKIGDVKTTHPQVGSRNLSMEPIPARDSIKKILSKIGDLPKEAEEELKDITDYKKRIRELQYELRRVPTKEIVKTVEDKRQIRSFMNDIKTKEREIAKLNSVISHAQKVLVNGSSIKHSLTVFETPHPIQIPEIKGNDKFKIFDTEPLRLRRGAIEMLKSVAMFDPKPITKHQIATLSVLSHKSGTFGTYLGELKREGYLEESAGRFSITKEGLELAGDVPSLPSDNQQILELWCSKFRAGASRMLRAIAEEYPNGLTKRDIADTASMEISGTFGTYLGELRRNGLIMIQGNGLITATKELFLEG